MGNSTSANQSLEQLLLNWEFVKETVDPLFGHIKVFSKKDSPDERVCLVSKVTNQNQNERPKSNNFDHPHILKVHYHKIEKKEEFCSNLNNVAFIYEYVTNNLQKNIEQRRELEKGFKESQIWSLIYQTASALSCMLEKGVNHSDLTPNNILLDNQGQVKLLDRSLTNNQVSGLAQAFMGIREDLHLSPEELELFRYGQLEPDKLNLHKCDIFQLGLSCIEALTLTSTSSMYSDSHKFDTDVLNQRFQLLEVFYSKKLINTLKSMLQLNPLDRPGFQSIISQIETYPGFNQTQLDISDMQQWEQCVQIEIQEKNQRTNRSSFKQASFQRNNNDTQISVQKRPPYISTFISDQNPINMQQMISPTNLNYFQGSSPKKENQTSLQLQERLNGGQKFVNISNTIQQNQPYYEQKGSLTNRLSYNKSDSLGSQNKQSTQQNLFDQIKPLDREFQSKQETNYWDQIMSPKDKKNQNLRYDSQKSANITNQQNQLFQSQEEKQISNQQNQRFQSQKEKQISFLDKLMNIVPEKIPIRDRSQRLLQVIDDTKQIQISQPLYENQEQPQDVIKTNKPEIQTFQPTQKNQIICQDQIHISPRNHQNNEKKPFDISKHRLNFEQIMNDKGNQIQNFQPHQNQELQMKQSKFIVSQDKQLTNLKSFNSENGSSNQSQTTEQTKRQQHSFQPLSQQVVQTSANPYYTEQKNDFNMTRTVSFKTSPLLNSKNSVKLLEVMNQKISPPQMIGSSKKEPNYIHNDPSNRQHALNKQQQDAFTTHFYRADYKNQFVSVTTNEKTIPSLRGQEIRESSNNISSNYQTQFMCSPKNHSPQREQSSYAQPQIQQSLYVSPSLPQRQQSSYATPKELQRVQSSYAPQSTSIPQKQQSPYELSTSQLPRQQSSNALPTYKASTRIQVGQPSIQDNQPITINKIDKNSSPTSIVTHDINSILISSQNALKKFAANKINYQACQPFQQNNKKVQDMKDQSSQKLQQRPSKDPPVIQNELQQILKETFKNQPKQQQQVKQKTFYANGSTPSVNDNHINKIMQKAQIEIERSKNGSKKANLI